MNSYFRGKYGLNEFEEFTPQIEFNPRQSAVKSPNYSCEALLSRNLDELRSIQSQGDSFAVSFEDIIDLLSAPTTTVKSTESQTETEEDEYTYNQIQTSVSTKRQVLFNKSEISGKNILHSKSVSPFVDDNIELRCLKSLVII